MSLLGGSPRGVRFAFGLARTSASALSTPVAGALQFEIVELPGENPAPFAGHFLSYRAHVDLPAHQDRSGRCGHRGERRVRVQHDIRSSLGTGRHCDDPALIGTTRLELRVYYRLSMDALDFRKWGEPSVSLLHRSLDPLFRIEGHSKATDALAASLFLINMEKAALFQKGKPACDGLLQLCAEAQREAHPSGELHRARVRFAGPRGQ